jgi:aromatic-L-amino-acid decarboxylase
MSQVFGDQWSLVSGLYIISHNLRLAFCKQDSEFLLAALSNKPVFLRNEATDNNLVVDYKDWQIPLGRRFRALKLWMVMRLYGTSGLQSFIRSHVSSAKHFESLVRADSRFEVLFSD